MSERGSSQDGGIGRNTSVPHTTKRRIKTNLKTTNNQQCQKIKLPGTPTTRESKKHSHRMVGRVETGDRQLTGEDARGRAPHR